jgi:hypothetical protein
MKSFKIALVSDDISSWTGSSKIDATYYIDIKKVLPDPNEYDKPYEVTFTFRSISASNSVSGLSMGNLIALCLDFSKGYTTFENRFSRNYAGLLTLNNDFTVYTSTACNIFFDTKETENAPIYLPNIRELNNIRLSVINVSTNDTITDNAFLKYVLEVCILTFKQL